MISNDKTLSETICESCGKEFSCGAENGECWCFAVEISPEDLAKLKKNFKNCLCRDCLMALTYSRRLFPANL